MHSPQIEPDSSFTGSSRLCSDVSQKVLGATASPEENCGSITETDFPELIEVIDEVGLLYPGVIEFKMLFQIE